MTEKLKSLMTITGKNDKKYFIAENSEDLEFLRFLVLRLNPYYTYGVKKIDRIPDNPDNSLTFGEFNEHLMLLDRSNINADLRAQTVKLLSRAHPDEQDVLAQIVTKELPLGVDTSVNKALGYKLIPTFNVMLASSYENSNFPVWEDTKLDGVRGIGIVRDNKAQLFTRNGRKLHFPRIEHDLVRLAQNQNLMFDTELTTEMRTSVSGICNRNLKKGYTADQDELMECNVFDVLPLDIFEAEAESAKQHERRTQLEGLFKATPGLTRAKLVEGQYIYSAEKLKEVANQLIANGEEGIIVKDPNAIYHYKRNKSWAKIKSINSCSLKVIGTVLGKGKRKGKVGALLCQTSDELLQVKVGSGLTDELVDLFTNVSPIGKIIEVHFNIVIRGRDSLVYSLFLPRYVNIRIDLDEADSLEKILSQHIGKPEIG